LVITLAAVAAVVLVSPLQAQALSDTSARIRGSVISDFNGRPLASVTISVPEVKKFVVTDSEGQFALAGLPAGKRSIRVSYEGRETEDFEFTLQTLQTKQLAVVLDVDAEDLNPLVVEAREPNIWRDLAGFYERRRTYGAFAHFFTREQITKMRPKRLSGLLTLEGIVTRCYQDCRPTRFTRGKLCVVAVSVDGVALREMDYDQIAVSDVAGVEVYRGVPPTDLNHSLAPTVGSSIWMGTGLSAAGQCGLVEIWTR
jgi:carboxypeptidase-like protein